MLAPNQRVLFTVSRRHHPWWRWELHRVPSRNLLIEPGGRGTGPAVLWATLEIARRDPDAIVALLPSDHYVDDEALLGKTLRSAITLARAEQAIALLGVVPEGPDASLGWILPEPGSNQLGSEVRAFVEKPGPRRAVELREAGGLWNTLLCAAPVGTLLDLYARALPELLDQFRAALSHRMGLGDLYRRLEHSDFCAHALTQAPELLRVVALPPCGWRDLGTPEHLARCLQGSSQCAARERALGAPASKVPDLRRVYESLRARSEPGG